MPFPLPHPIFIFSLAFVLFALEDLYGLIFLFSGFILFDRNFAYTHLQFGPVPLYIPEFSLLCWVLMALLRRRGQLLDSWRETPSVIRWSWGIYLLTGLYSLARGLRRYPLLNVVRDFALCYYSAALFLIAGIDWTEKRIRLLLRVLGVMTILRALSIINLKLAYLIPMRQIMGGQPAATSMALGIGLIFWLVLDEKPRLSTITYVSAVLIITAITTQMARSAWTGLIAGFFVGVWGLSRLTDKSLLLKRTIRSSALIGISAALLVAGVSRGRAALERRYIRLHPPLNTMEPKVPKVALQQKVQPVALPPSPSASPLIVTPVIKTSAETTPLMASTAPLQAILQIHLSNPPKISSMPMPPASSLSSGDQMPNPTLYLPPVPETPKTAITPESPPEPVQHARKPLFIPEVPLSRQIYDEFLSFFKGRQSENVLTRLWMWRDALSEVFCVGLFSPSFQAGDFKQYHLPPDPKPTGSDLYSLPIAGFGFEGQYVCIRTYPHSSGQQTPQEIWHRVHRALFGIPFGKPFLPPEVVWVVNSANRYDPHNSFIAIMYRMGLVGFFSFAVLGISIVLFGCSAFKNETGFYAVLYIAIVSALTSFAVHSLTDNTLENPFKGLWYWSLLGLCCGIARGWPRRDPAR